MKKKLNHEDRKKIIKNSAKRAKKVQSSLELNYYVQQKVMEYPETYIEEIRKDIVALEKTLAK